MKSENSRYKPSEVVIESTSEGLYVRHGNLRAGPFKTVNDIDTIGESALFNLAELKKQGLKAGNLLAADPNVFEKWMQHLSRTVKHDEVIKRMVALTGVSAFTPDPMNLFLLGEPSIGKTYNPTEAMKYFPKENVWYLGE